MALVNYKEAGVDIDAGNEAVSRMKQHVEATFAPEVLTSIGSFGALFDLAPIMKNYRHPVLVQSIDGVGTKMMMAKMMQQYTTIGIDLVSATTNDIIVLGAKPLTLLDYIANDHLQPHVIEQIIMGMSQACRLHDISLVGGETAEMPGTYLPGEHDLVGVITGVLEKEEAILGKNIQPGDVVLGLASSGLHTNGYSLARKLLFEVAGYTVDTYLSDLNTSVGEALLKPHINYTLPIRYLLAQAVPIKGMAHITGGGLIENIPRVLPDNCSVVLKSESWPKLPIFDLLCRLGRLSEQESHRTFNMGIGMVMIVAPAVVAQCRDHLAHYPEFQMFEIGEVVVNNQMQRVSLSPCV